jgi:tRNA U38,U39,U40 pseudouridine synthase TruA
VGTLRLAGKSEAPVGHAGAVLEARHRAAARQTAPAEGLYLEGVEYRNDVSSQEGWSAR